MSKKYVLRSYILLLLVFLMGVIFSAIVYAAEPTGEYLQYQEPRATSFSSGLSTITYVFSLLVTFAIVLGLAYFSSRFLGQRMGNRLTNGEQKIVATLPLGTNRAVYIVEIAGKYLVLGVTDHTINVLQEITDPAEIEKLKLQQTAIPETQFEQVFQKQLASLQRISPKFTNVFHAYQQNKQKHEDEKR